MGKRHGHLIERIADLDNLRDAYIKTARGKRLTWGYLEFKEYAAKNLLAMREQLLDGAWEQGEYRQFTIYEPKPRLISALDFKDRLAQHALVNVIGPIFEASLLPYTFACREGMGTHAGVRHIQALLRSTKATHFLKTDYSRFFPSIDRARLHRLIERKIKRYLTANDHESLDRFIASWRGHAAHADTCNLFNHLENRYGIHCHQHP